MLQAPFDPLAFIHAWAAWRCGPNRPHVLHVVADCEQAPDLSDLKSALRACDDDAALHPLALQLIDQWWGLLPGQHRLRFDDALVCLTLRIGAAAIEAAKLNTNSFASTDLPQTATHITEPEATQTVVVVGAGLAGAATARALAIRGWQVQVLEAGNTPASGASGLPVGLVVPHTSPDDSIVSRLSRAGVRAMQQAMQSLLKPGIDWSPTGVQERRLPGKTRKGGAPLSWSTQFKTAGDMWTRNADQPAPTNALWHKKGAWLRPASLVKALLDHPNITWQGDAYVSSLAFVKANADTNAQAIANSHAQGHWQALHNDRVLAQASRVVLACGPASKGLIQQVTQKEWPINPLRGQVSWGLMQDAPDVPLPDTPVNGNGSFVHHVPTPEGDAWFAGATFDRINATAEVLSADHQENFQRLQALLPDTAQGMHNVFQTKVRGWAAVRCSVPDRLPVVGPIDQAPSGLWVNTAMGSRGLTLAWLCGELLAARWHNEPLPVEPQLARALNAQRYQR